MESDELPFEVGERIRRQALHQKYGGNQYSGSSPCGDFPYVFIFTGEEGRNYGYEDEFLPDGIFIYTGQGQEGDMTFDRTDPNGRNNLAIRDHQQESRSLHVFETDSMDDTVRVYLGEYKYENHHWRRLPDKNDNMRDAIRFELQSITDNEVVQPEEDIKNLSEKGLRELAEGQAEGHPRQHQRQATGYRTSDAIKDYAKRWADGVCQGCGEEAPFEDKHGEPFLEVHHVFRLSDGGPDHPDAVIAICPNCHRRSYYGCDNKQFNRELIGKLHQHAEDTTRTSLIHYITGSSLSRRGLDGRPGVPECAAVGETTLLIRTVPRSPNQSIWLLES